MRDKIRCLVLISISLFLLSNIFTGCSGDWTNSPCPTCSDTVFYGGPVPTSPLPTQTASPTPITSPPTPPFFTSDETPAQDKSLNYSASNNKLLVWLSGPNIRQISSSTFPVVIIDYSADGTGERAFTKSEITSLKRIPGGGTRLVICYLSVGEAEDYRWYWQSDWIPDPYPPFWQGNPLWLGSVNSNWPGNYLVKYWEPGWQSIVYQYLDAIIGMNFDGVYLDVIDAYIRIQSPPYNISSGRTDMERFIKEISQYAKQKNSKFKIFASNAEELAALPNTLTPNTSYINSIDGVGKESLYWSNGKRSPEAIRYDMQYINILKKAGKSIYTIDFPPLNSPSSIRWAQRQASYNKTTEYCGPPTLDKIVKQI